MAVEFNRKCALWYGEKNGMNVNDSMSDDELFEVIQDEIGECFISDSQEDLANKLKEYGHRFPNNRASYISESVKCKNKLNKIIQHDDKYKIREWIVKNI